VSTGLIVAAVVAFLIVDGAIMLLFFPLAQDGRRLRQDPRPR
jgi:hypothetical protein